MSTLDRPMAQSEALHRVLRTCGGPVEIRSTERITDPATDRGLWEIVLTVPRAATRR